MRNLFLTALLSLSLAPNLVSVLAIDCGCPKTCNADALAERNDAPWNCGHRIAWLMKHHDLPEANACLQASKIPSLPQNHSDNMRAPCRYEACDPHGCGSTLTVDPNPNPPITCGCANCTNEELDKVQGPYVAQNWTCRERIHHFKHHWHNSEWEACAAASRQGSCSVEACDPNTCGSTLKRPDDPDDEEEGVDLFAVVMSVSIVLVIVVPAAAILYYRWSTTRKEDIVLDETTGMPPLPESPSGALGYKADPNRPTSPKSPVYRVNGSPMPLDDLQIPNSPKESELTEMSLDSPTEHSEKLIV